MDGVRFALNDREVWMINVALRSNLGKLRYLSHDAWAFLCKFTLPETHIAPENRPLEKEIPIGNHHF